LAKVVFALMPEYGQVFVKVRRPVWPCRLFQIAKAYGRHFERTCDYFYLPNIAAPELAAFGFVLFEHSSGELPLYIF